MEDIEDLCFIPSRLCFLFSIYLKSPKERKIRRMTAPTGNNIRFMLFSLLFSV